MERQALAEIAMMSSLSFVLGLIQFKVWGQGGSVSLVMVPIVLIAFRRGPLVGVVTGSVAGTLKLVFEFAKIFHPLSVFFDYILAYGAIGLSGLFFNRKAKTKNNFVAKIVGGTLLGGLIRLLLHIFCGVAIFSGFCPKGENLWIYSLCYNASYLLPELALTLTVVLLIKKYRKNVFQVENVRESIFKS